jgi:uncharacterized protein
MIMILEGLVTTLDPDGTPHLAPMGPRVSPEFDRLTLRPFPTSQTYRNLLRDRQGVFHVTDDALLLAKSAIGEVKPFPDLLPAERINGFVILDSCRHYEFVVRSVDDSAQRISLEAEVVQSGRTRDFFGFNRAKHAVVEAAILATRLHLLPLTEVASEFRKLRTIIDKTGGPAEQEAMNLLESRLREKEAGL